MMQEYDDDFFFEEDKIDPRMYPPGPGSLNMFEDRMNGIAELNHNAEFDDIADSNDTTEWNNIVEMNAITQMNNIAEINKIAEMNNLAFMNDITEMNDVIKINGGAEMNDITDSNVIMDMNTITDLNGTTDSNVIVDMNTITDMNGITDSNVIMDMNTITDMNGSTDSNVIIEMNTITDMNGITDSNVIIDMNTITDINDITDTNCITGMSGIIPTTGMSDISDMNCVTGMSGIIPTNNIIDTNNITDTNGVTGMSGITHTDNTSDTNTITKANGITAKNHVAGKSGTEKKNLKWDPERVRRLRERKAALTLAAETRRKRKEMMVLPDQTRRLPSSGSNHNDDQRVKAAGSSSETQLPATVQKVIIPEWQRRRRLIQGPQNNTPGVSATVSSQDSVKDVPDLNTREEKPLEEQGEAESTDCIFNDLRRERYMIYHQDLMGMTVTSGSVVLMKDEKNLIGISIGGGAPLCPCLYIVQIFDNTPAFKEGTLQSGDELVGVNGQSVKGKTKVEVAKMIQSAKEKVIIIYNKLHADPKQGVSLDIIMKKMKHRLVENMSSGAADALGLSRAILCNDTLVAKLDELKDTETVYRKLVEHARRMLKSYFDLLQTYKALGDVFAAIGVREPQARASEAFTKFGQYHRVLETDGIKTLKGLKPILADLGTYLNKVIPDTKLTIRKYADTKFEYLSYCLKVKEMDDEEYGYNTLQEPLYRVETGNYEYRLILRCRQEARTRFARQRSDVLVKLELLENKKTQDVSFQLRRFIAGFAAYYDVIWDYLKANASLFPVEMDLSQNAFQYKSTAQVIQDNAEDENEIEFAKELNEFSSFENVENHMECVAKEDNSCLTTEMESTESYEQLLPDFDAIEKPADNKTGLGSFGIAANDKTSNDTDKPEYLDNFSLLTELGLTDDFGDFQQGILDDFMPINMDPQNIVDDVYENMLSDL